MKRRIIVVLIVLALIGGGAVLVRNKSLHNAQDATPQVASVVVDARPLKLGQVTLTQRASADVQALRDSVIASRLTAYVVALPLYEGDRFKRGDLLARLDMSASGHAQASSLDADLVAAASTIKAEQERLRRSRSLYEIQGVSQEQLEFAEAAFTAAVARQALAKENQRNAVVTAPFDGVVSQRLAQPGDLVTPGKPLLKIVDTRSGNRLLIGVPDSVRPSALRVGDHTLGLRAWPEAGLQGVRRYEARTADRALIPGSRIEVRAVVFESTQAALLPPSCTLNDDGRFATVLRLRQGGKVEPLRVALAAAGEEGAASLDGRLASQRVACASADILIRLAAGAPFHIGGER